MIRVTLPWPPQATSANASGQGKWRKKSEAAKSYKATCAWMIRAANVPRIDFAPIVSVTFCAPAAVSRYDLDNTLGRAKQGLDALSDALGVDDGRWPEMRLKRGPKGGVGSIIIDVMKPVAVIPFRGTVS